MRRIGALAAALATFGAGLLLGAVWWSQADRHDMARAIRKVAACDDPSTCYHLASRDFGEPSVFVDGVEVELDILQDRCVFEVSWRTGDAGPYFRATMFPSSGAIFPLQGALVELKTCGLCDLVDKFPMATLQVLDAAHAEGLAPAEDSVFIPAGGWATLDGDQRARAMVSSTSAYVFVSTAGYPETRYGLGVGESFVWSNRLATVRRLVSRESDRAQMGWVEIGLSPAGK
jgi:hypothetical protein